MPRGKITPVLWYHTKDGKAKNATVYYANIFGADFVAGNPVPLGETPSGYTEICNVKLFDSPYLFMSTAVEHHPFNDAFSITIHCEDQAEIDKYWNYFTQEGKESNCGWCTDKFGLRWQIIPENFGELMQKPNAGQVMSRQKKIVIEEYSA